MIPILVLKTENKVIYNKSNLNCKTFFEEFIYIFLIVRLPLSPEENMRRVERFQCF